MWSSQKKMKQLDGPGCATWDTCKGGKVQEGDSNFDMYGADVHWGLITPKIKGWNHKEKLNRPDCE